MRYQVPQFIEVEDKIFGPLTLKQFIYLGGSIGIIVVIFSFTPRILAFILSTPVVALGLALAFYKVNNKPFLEMIEAFFHYNTNGKLYIWHKTARKIKKGSEQTDRRTLEVPKLANSKLKDLTWTLDVKEQNNPITKETNPPV